MPIPTNQLLQQAVEGDRDALSKLLDEVSDGLARQLTPQIHDKWRSVLDVEDVMQVTFVEVFLDIERFSGVDVAEFRNWLARIARNNLTDAIRGLQCEKRPQPDQRVHTANRDESYLALVEQLGAVTTSVATKAALHEMATFLDRALTQLPPDYEQVLRLYDLKGLSGPEVAAQMGRRRSAIHMLRSRALLRLREQIGPESQFFSFTSNE